MNPLFADDDSHKKHPKKDDPGYVLPNRHGRTIKPLHDNSRPHASGYTPGVKRAGDSPSNPAADLIRQKLETLYAEEPEASQEAHEVAAQSLPQRSKHQQFMYELSTSGKSLAQIQTEWHTYYVNLPDDEKHQVWQEFYAANNKNTVLAQSQIVPTNPTPKGSTHSQQQAERSMAPIAQKPALPANPIFGEAPTAAENMVTVAPEMPTMPERAKKHSDKRTAQAIRHQITKRVRLNSKAQAKAVQHVKSLLVGLGSGAAVLLIVLFGLFNEMVIAPFIQPSSHASATPIILSTDGVAPSATPEVIIPKINVEIPVDYSLTSNNEEEIQKGLETGVVHYPTTVKPGERGNAAFFGHSSNNIFNPGKYKFAFVLLHELAPGDIFYLTYNNKVYTYKVYDKQIVSPSQVTVLNSVEGKTATATLITCDPPGTSLNRLVVWGEQISPDPNGATAPIQSPVSSQPQSITGNGPSLWKRLTGWISGGN